MFRKKTAVSVMALLLCVLLCGSIFKQSEMALNVEKSIVYQNDTMETFLIRSKSNSNMALKTYHNSYYVFLGILRAKMTGNKKIYLGSLTSYTTDTLYCVAANDDVQAQIADLMVGNTVKAYGKMTYELNGTWTLTVDKIEKSSDTSVVSTAYSTVSGMTIDQQKMISRELGKGKVKYWIPADWESVEKDLIKTKLGTMEGYQYCLNEIKNQSVQPESLFVCYFDNEKQLLRSGDKNETELIERAIVKNILKEDPGAASLRKTTYYGAEYHYYQSAYKTELGQNYHAEFVFQPIGTEGFVVYLYVYREKAHLDECLITMRLTEVQ